MNGNPKLGVKSPLGDLVIIYKGPQTSFCLNEKGVVNDGVEAKITVKESSPALPKGMSVEATYLMTISIKALTNISEASLEIGLENNKSDDHGSSDPGEYFESIFWNNDDYIAHCGFRTTKDEGLNAVDDFDRFDIEWAPAGLRLVLPELQKGDDIIFYACFAWAKKTKEDDVSTWFATDAALPMKKQI